MQASKEIRVLKGSVSILRRLHGFNNGEILEIVYDALKTEDEYQAQQKEK